MDKKNFLNPSDFTNFESMAPGPNHLEIPTKLPTGSLHLRTLTGTCMNWNKNQNNLVAVNLSKHEQHINAYAFLVLNLNDNTIFFVGWIAFEELLKKAKVVVKDKISYLTIPIKQLPSPEELLAITYKTGERKSNEN